MEPNPNTKPIKLWEVFAVLVIISIMAAIVFPVFSNVHKKAPQSSCASNEKQLGLAFLQYVQDYNGRWPTGTQTSPLLPKPRRVGVGWAGQIYSYVKSVYLYKCPDDETPHSINPPSGAVSYAYNSNIATAKGKAFNWLPTADVSDASKTVLIFEVTNVLVKETLPEGVAAISSPAGNGLDRYLFSFGDVRRGQAQYATGYLSGRQPSPAPGQFDSDSGRHEGGSNFLLADGHVKWFKPGAVSSGWDAATANAPQTGTTLGHAAGTADTTYAVTFSTR